MNPRKDEMGRRGCPPRRGEASHPTGLRFGRRLSWLSAIQWIFGGHGAGRSAGLTRLQRCLRVRAFSGTSAGLSSAPRGLTEWGVPVKEKAGKSWFPCRPLPSDVVLGSTKKRSPCVLIVDGMPVQKTVGVGFPEGLLPSGYPKDESAHTASRPLITVVPQHFFRRLAMYLCIRSIPGVDADGSDCIHAFIPFDLCPSAVSLRASFAGCRFRGWWGRTFRAATTLSPCASAFAWLSHL